MAMAPLEPIAELEPSDGASAVLAYLSALEARPAVDLAQLLAVAALTTRVDQKYLVPTQLLPDLLGRLPDRLAVLSIDDRRLFDYESVYFDTECFELYHQHVQGRRKRYKARTRTYRDTGEVMLEVKLKGHRGETVKERLPYDAPGADELTGEGLAFLHSVVDEAYGLTVPDLGPRLTTAYRRSTLADLELNSRVTIDLDLRWSDGETCCAASDLALVETKSGSGVGPVDRVLGGMGIRPVRMSKYCIGVALLHPQMPANKWNRLLVRHFGWQREDVAG
jgi:VTC domain